MKIIDIYSWALPKQVEFLERFKNNESLYHQARLLWDKLEACTVWFIVAFVALAIVFTFVYYGPYNNKPGRHYKVSRWGVFMIITAVVAFLVTLLIGVTMAKSSLSERIDLALRISVASAIYSVVCYLICSFLVCNMPFLKTNAYRLLKIGK